MNNLTLESCIMRKSTNINILRFICALLVILCHSFAITSGKEDFFSEFNGGQCNLGGISVAVFFFISGLYVSKSLDHTKSLKTFIIKRVVRLFPQLWGVVIISTIVGAVLSKLSVLKYIFNPYTFLYLLNGLLIPIHELPGVFVGMPYQTVNGSLWTLPVEFFAYISLAVMAVIVNIFKGKIKKYQLDLVVFFILLTILVIVIIGIPQSMITTIIRPTVIFYEGVIFYDFRSKIQINPLVGAIGLFLIIIFAKTVIFNIYMVVIFPYSIVSLAFGISDIPINWRLFDISYEMYLLGWPIQQIVMWKTEKSIPIYNAVVSAVIDILGAWILFLVTNRIIEKRK